MAQGAYSPIVLAPGVPDAKEVALVCDLDCTLCRTDTLHEALLRLLIERPFAFLGLLLALARGRAKFKAQLADLCVVPGDALPLNEEVIAAVQAARAEGRRTALVTAANQRQAEAVAASTGLFDEVKGSTADCNLKGLEKRQFLVDRYGEAGFDYIGDSKVDLIVWQQARRAITVGAGRGFRRRVEETIGGEVTHLSPPAPRLPAMLRALRPYQWSKNLLVFVPILTSQDFIVMALVVMAFLAFCLAASAVYVINDILDLAVDRVHPRKRTRPFASGELSARTGLAVAVLLLLAAFALATAIGQPRFVIVLALYLVATSFYSLWLKRILLLDVLVLAGLYTTRIVAGGAAAGTELSPWLLGFSMFLFLGLAAVKRQTELVDQQETNRPSCGRAYEVADLPVLRELALASSMAAVVVLALYIASDDVQLLYATPALLWLLCPIVLFWMLRMVLMAHRGQMTDDPIVFAARDAISQITVSLGLITVLSATFL